METKMKKSTLICSTIALAAAVLVSGCVVAPAPYHYHAAVVYPEVAPAPVVTFVAPPAPYVETVGVPPVEGYFWISGVWLWEGGRHVWHAGHWQAPKPGYRWVPHHWHQVGNEWHMDGGHWQH
jgi:hypothetical protein